MRHLLFLTDGPVSLSVVERKWESGCICWFYPWLLMHNLSWRIWGIKCESNSASHVLVVQEKNGEREVKGISSATGKWQMYQSKDSCWEGELLFEFSLSLSFHSLSLALTAISWQLIQLMAMSCSFYPSQGHMERFNLHSQHLFKCMMQWDIEGN